MGKKGVPADGLREMEAVQPVAVGKWHGKDVTHVCVSSDRMVIAQLWEQVQRACKDISFTLYRPLGGAGPSALEHFSEHGLAEFLAHVREYGIQGQKQQVLQALQRLEPEILNLTRGAQEMAAMLAAVREKTVYSLARLRSDYKQNRERLLDLYEAESEAAKLIGQPQARDEAMQNLRRRSCTLQDDFATSSYEAMRLLFVAVQATQNHVAAQTNSRTERPAEGEPGIARRGVLLADSFH
ncbi:hypothetical protein [Pseudomonas entomophila]|uniref:hypothetical protein n=1 Tax=Pseudomonas entomophila TaxID=312306 RepID=UPI001F01F305|nr:hypothetical protein [Pseudomonas entomophila]MCG8291476.1 hypothetical protein [Pseudomonas entomophila]